MDQTIYSNWATVYLGIQFTIINNNQPDRVGRFHAVHGVYHTSDPTRSKDTSLCLGVKGPLLAVQKIV